MSTQISKEGATQKVVQAVRWYAAEHGLSRQETRLLQCAFRGLSDKAAADELGCARNTVGTYWTRIFQKTGHRPQREVLAHVLRTVLSAQGVTAAVPTETFS